MNFGDGVQIREHIRHGDTANRGREISTHSRANFLGEYNGFNLSRALVELLLEWKHAIRDLDDLGSMLSISARQLRRPLEIFTPLLPTTCLSL